MTLLEPRIRSCLYIKLFMDMPTNTENTKVKNEEIQKDSPTTSNKKKRKYIDKSKVEPCAKWTNREVEYIRENPDATKAYIEPAISAFTNSWEAVLSDPI